MTRLVVWCSRSRPGSSVWSTTVTLSGVRWVIGCRSYLDTLSRDDDRAVNRGRRIEAERGRRRDDVKRITARRAGKPAGAARNRRRQNTFEAAVGVRRQRPGERGGQGVA